MWSIDRSQGIAHSLFDRGEMRAIVAYPNSPLEIGIADAPLHSDADV
jgi:hypothetical protein